MAVMRSSSSAVALDVRPPAHSLFARRCWFAGCVGLALGLAGCSHLVERRVISAFAESLNDGDVARLRKVSSTHFASKALPEDEALASLKTLDLPDGKVKVTKVEEVDETTRKVTVEVGEKKRRLVYQLTRADEKSNWVVDDLFLKSREKGTGRSVAEQVSLLVAVREFVESWQSSDRQRILGSVAPDMRQALGEVPEPALLVLCQGVVAGLSMEQTQPSAIINEDTADVRVPTESHVVVVQMERDGDGWLARRVSVEGRRGGGTVDSVAEMAVVTRAVLEFHRSYRGADKQTLERLCTSKFYDGSLSVADLSLVPLPDMSDDARGLDIKIEGGVAHCVVNGDKEVLKVSLLKQPQEDPLKLPEYRVDEVALYELSGAQDKRLSVLFTGHALLQVYGEALAARDLDGLRLGSTSEFNQMVWNKLDERRVRNIPLPGVKTGAMRIVNSAFQGSTTRITVEQGGQPVTYVLRDQGGRVLMDDVLTPAFDRPQSLKLTLEAMIPVTDFAQAFAIGAIAPETPKTDFEKGAARSRVDSARGNSSREFCRVVWNQVDHVPRLGRNPHEFFQQPLNQLELKTDRAIVVLGDDNRGAKIQLVREHGQYVVDDVELIAGPLPDQRQSLRRLLRTTIHEGG
jgi:hypothetical protein